MRSACAEHASHKTYAFVSELSCGRQEAEALAGATRGGGAGPRRHGRRVLQLAADRSAAASAGRGACWSAPPRDSMALSALADSNNQALLLLTMLPHDPLCEHPSCPCCVPWLLICSAFQGLEWWCDCSDGNHCMAGPPAQARPASGPPAKRHRGVTWGAPAALRGAAPATATPPSLMTAPGLAAGPASAPAPLRRAAAAAPRWGASAAGLQGLVGDAALLGAEPTGANAPDDIIDLSTSPAEPAVFGDMGQVPASEAAGTAALSDGAGGAEAFAPRPAWGADTQAAAETLEALLCAAGPPAPAPGRMTEGARLRDADAPAPARRARPRARPAQRGGRKQQSVAVPGVVAPTTTHKQSELPGPPPGAAAASLGGHCNGDTATEPPAGNGMRRRSVRQRPASARAASAAAASPPAGAGTSPLDGCRGSYLLVNANFPWCVVMQFDSMSLARAKLG